MKMNDFYKDRVIWIVGASTGIGRALAVELSERGAKLALSARRQDKLESLNEELGGVHLVMPFDAGDMAAYEESAQSIKTHMGRLDSIVFMAAIYSAHDGEPKPISFVHNMINVNLGGAFNSVYASMPVFQEQACDDRGFQGQIVLCGSVAGYRGLPYGQPYCATKAGIINYAESLRVELARANVDVKVINPGFVKTPLTDKNNFAMPMMIEAGEAAAVIANDMARARVFEIHFPKRFTFIMKILRLLPHTLYFALAKRINVPKS